MIKDKVMIKNTIKSGNRTKAPRQKAPHYEIIIESYNIFFFYIDVDILDILKIKTLKKRSGGINTKNLKYLFKNIICHCYGHL